jgi:hypothetical protein
MRPFVNYAVPLTEPNSVLNDQPQNISKQQRIVKPVYKSTVAQR